MLGRAAYHEPGLLGEVDRRVFGEATMDVSAEAAVARYRPYVERQLDRGVSLAALIKPMLGLFMGRPGARSWRRILTVESVRAGAGVDVIDRALTALDEAAARRQAA